MPPHATGLGKNALISLLTCDVSEPVVMDGDTEYEKGNSRWFSNQIKHTHSLTLENNFLFSFPLPQVEDVVGCHVEDAVTFWAQVN